MTLPRVRLYTKPECELCEKAERVVERARRRMRFHLEKVDITADPDLYRRYRYRIPVVEIDGREAFDYNVSEDRLLAALRG